MSVEQIPASVGRGAAPTKTNWILLVDDDLELGETMQAVLEDDGYQVMVAHDGADALQRLPNMPLPDLIVLDLQMPKLSGTAFMEELARHPQWKGVPVLVVSGDPEGVEKATHIGARGYLVKPVRIHEFSNVVARMSRRH